MSVLSVKTKGNSSPQGKARVYFCCYPEDFEKYFEVLCQDIFATQNCAIYYESDWEHEAEKETLDTMLGDMQLFIVPLTTAFLFKECRACDYEYGFAMEHHIPILPIAMEEGIDQLFAERMNRVGEGYGDIQFLNRVSTDHSEIPYSEKLKNILNGILVGDELAARVRAAFDAYIFLSYRKKDRVYAKELMKLIHRIPYCRDIAIWYDEFLVPGEGWNQAIREAMEKSSLVAMAVTPSIVEPGNFIVKQEYPDAVKVGKEIVPAEIVATDHDALTRLFEGISTPVDGKDAQALEKALKSLALKENNHEPEHNFLIGLAYLGAIDVERDPEKAAALITSAAEAELPEAIEKLAGMYNTGEGVDRNYLTAVEWQEKLVTVLEKTKADPLADRDIVSALWSAGYMWKKLGKLSPAKRCFEKMLDQAVRRDDLYHSLETKRDRSISYEQLGIICEESGDLKEARSYYEKSLHLREKLAEEAGTVESRRDLSIGYDDVGGICERSGDLSGAQSYYEKVLHLREKLAEETGTVESRRYLSRSYINFGDIREKSGDLSGARSYYEKALHLSEGLAEETETVESYRDLSINYNVLGSICEKSGDLSGARSYYEKSLYLRERLVEHTGSVESRRDLSISYGRLGNLREKNGDLKGARSYYEKSLHLREALAGETGTVASRRDLSISYGRLGDLCEKSGDLNGARSYYEKSLHLDETLAEETGTVESRRDLSVIYDSLGYICQQSGDLSGAGSYYEKSLHLSETLAEEIGTVESRRDLSISYDNMGIICRENGDLSRARSYFEKALHLNETLAEEIGTVESHRDLSISCERLGGICERSGDLKEARSYYEKSLHMRMKLAMETGTIESYDDLASSYYEIGFMGNGDVEMINKAYRIYCRLAEACPGVVKYTKNRDILGRILKKRK